MKYLRVTEEKVEQYAHRLFAFSTVDSMHRTPYPLFTRLARSLRQCILGVGFQCSDSQNDNRKEPVT